MPEVAANLRPLWALCVLCAISSSVEARVRLRGQGPGRLLHRVDPNFVSVTIDSSLAEDPLFMRMLSSPKVRVLAKALSPAFVRFGGTRQDFMQFQPQGKSRGPSGFSHNQIIQSEGICQSDGEHLLALWRKQKQRLTEEDASRKYRQSTLDELYTFANVSGLDLIFGLNALLRNDDNSWNSSNAQALLRYCEERRYRLSWELGNGIIPVIATHCFQLIPSCCC
uniref:Heparanase n=1 Tax=Hippocampus comes TaxID=109280 RepID=A0A3Q2XZT2_HIPCM